MLTAAREGLGVTPLPRTGPPPEGLRHIGELPAMSNVNLYMATSERIEPSARAAVLAAVRGVLNGRPTVHKI